MIPAFILNQVIPRTKHTFQTLDVNPSNYQAKNNLYKSLKAALEWAINSDEDVILCSTNESYLQELDLIFLENILGDVISEKINVIFLNVKHKESIPINKDLEISLDIQEINSFIVIKPLFSTILDFLDRREKNYPDIDWVTFMTWINPHLFKLSDKKHILNSRREHKIHVISTFRNVANFIQESWQSIDVQNEHNYNVYYIDDASNDGSSELIPNITCITKKINTERKFALHNILDILTNEPIDDEDIVCLIDADDSLAHKYVFNIINNIYQNSSILMTYGSMQNTGSLNKIGSNYSKKEFESLRESIWKVSHLRTFKFKVFKEYFRQDPNLNLLRDQAGQLLKMPYDMALLFPLMELCGFDRVKFLPCILYKYRIHELNDSTLHRELQSQGEVIIRNKQKLKKHPFSL